MTCKCIICEAGGACQTEYRKLVMELGNYVESEGLQRALAAESELQAKELLARDRKLCDERFVANTRYQDERHLVHRLASALERFVAHCECTCDGCGAHESARLALAAYKKTRQT